MVWNRLFLTSLPISLCLPENSGSSFPSFFLSRTRTKGKGEQGDFDPLSGTCCWSCVFPTSISDCHNDVTITMTSRPNREDIYHCIWHCLHTQWRSKSSWCPFVLPQFNTYKVPGGSMCSVCEVLSSTRTFTRTDSHMIFSRVFWFVKRFLCHVDYPLCRFRFIILMNRLCIVTDSCVARSVSEMQFHTILWWGICSTARRKFERAVTFVLRGDSESGRAPYKFCFVFMGRHNQKIGSKFHDGQVTFSYKFTWWFLDCIIDPTNTCSTCDRVIQVTGPMILLPNMK